MLSNLLDLLVRRLADRIVAALVTVVLLVLCIDSTSRSVVVCAEQVFVIAPRLLHDIAVVELMDIFDSITTCLWEEEDGP